MQPAALYNRTIATRKPRSVKRGGSMIGDLLKAAAPIALEATKSAIGPIGTAVGERVARAISPRKGSGYRLAGMGKKSRKKSMSNAEILNQLRSMRSSSRRRSSRSKSRSYSGGRRRRSSSRRRRSRSRSMSSSRRRRSRSYSGGRRRRSSSRRRRSRSRSYSGGRRRRSSKKNTRY